MYFSCFNTSDGSIYLRVNMFMFGLIIFILGIQGICDIFNEKIQSYENIESMSIGLIIGGGTLITLAFLKCEEKNIPVYINI